MKDTPLHPEDALVADVCPSLPEARATARQMGLKVTIVKCTLRRAAERHYEEIASEAVK